MAKNKTEATDENVEDFIVSFTDNEQKRADSFQLLQLMEEISGHPPKMWGPSIIGFGTYHYQYKSGHEGDAPLIGFSPRKAALSLYVFTGLENHRHLLENLGKFTMGKACIYVKKLEDINQVQLRKLMTETIRYLKSTYGDSGN